MEKKCKKCNVVKDASEFHKAKSNKDGLNTICGECRKVTAKRYREANKEKRTEYAKKYNAANKEKQKQYREANKGKTKQYRDTNKERLIEYRKQYNKENKEKAKEYYQENRERIGKVHKKYREVNKEKAIDYEKNYRENYKGKRNNSRKSRRKTDSLYKLTINTRRAVTRYLKDGKSKRTKEIIGIGFKEFQDYLEVEYTEGMHLDHIVPLSWAINDEEVYILNHYSNFQIITAEENLDKKDFYCKSENLKKVLDNHNDLTKLKKIIERNSDKIK
ncbi:hypothetical protein OAD34_04715 [Flavobacteriaceae bacterium]|nr:hypothetical protein [Flavobacteriaceae bacterium]